MPGAYILAALLAFAIATFAAACGSPGSDTRAFKYDPIPYTVVIERGTPVAVAVDDRGNKFRADSLSVVVRSAQLPDFEEWSRGLGFRFGATQPTVDVTFVELLVPPGSAPDALALVKTQDVIAAGLAYYAMIED